MPVPGPTGYAFNRTRQAYLATAPPYRGDPLVALLRIDGHRCRQLPCRTRFVDRSLSRRAHLRHALSH